MIEATDSNALFRSALQAMWRRGCWEITAADLADELWPNCRSHNSNGQNFNLAAGVAGRMLRRFRGCYEVRNRVWLIEPGFLERNAEADTSK